MLWTRFRQAKNKKGMTLIEMLAAIAITAILAAVLSMMIIPVMNTYKTNATKVELAQAVTTRLNDIALFLRGATGVYLSDAKRNVSKTWYPGQTFSNTNTAKMYNEANYFFPEIRWKEKQSNESETVKSRRVEFDGLRTVLKGGTRCYAFVMDDYYKRNGGVTGYLYPELIIADWSNMSKRYLDYGSDKKKVNENFSGMSINSDDYQSKEYWCPDNGSMYFLVRTNADDENRANVLEIHLTVKKGDISYEGMKTIVCENLVINKDVIYTTNFQSWSGSNLNKKAATVSTSSSTTKYYTVWFTLRN